jgi:Glyoxalase-like domain
VADEEIKYHPFQVTMDCANPRRQAQFWAKALGYVPQPPPPGFASWAAFAASVGLGADELDNVAALVDPSGLAPRLLLLRVPEQKTAKNRLHLDINVRLDGAGQDDRRRQAVRLKARELVAAGAQLVGEREDNISWWITLLDPEGNEFCLQ